MRNVILAIAGICLGGMLFFGGCHTEKKSAARSCPDDIPGAAVAAVGLDDTTGPAVEGSEAQSLPYAMRETPSFEARTTSALPACLLIADAKRLARFSSGEASHADDARPAEILLASRFSDAPEEDLPRAEVNVRSKPAPRPATTGPISAVDGPELDMNDPVTVMPAELLRNPKPEVVMACSPVEAEPATATPVTLPAATTPAPKKAEAEATPLRPALDDDGWWEKADWVESKIASRPVLFHP